MLKSATGHITKNVAKKVILATLVIGFIASVASYGMGVNSSTVLPNGVDIEERVNAALAEKVRGLENEVIEELARCESHGAEEPDAAIILDSNNEISIGKLMYQRSTVQHYVKQFYGRDITRKEAILIAIDAHPDISLDELTRKVLFEDEKGWRNWWVCGNRIGIAARIDIINKIR
jgi:hypothetical protein